MNKQCLAFLRCIFTTLLNPLSHSTGNGPLTYYWAWAQVIIFATLSTPVRISSKLTRLCEFSTCFTDLSELINNELCHQTKLTRLPSCYIEVVRLYLKLPKLCICYPRLLGLSSSSLSELSTVTSSSSELSTEHSNNPTKLYPLVSFSSKPPLSSQSSSPWTLWGSPCTKMSSPFSLSSYASAYPTIPRVWTTSPCFRPTSSCARPTFEWG